MERPALPMARSGAGHPSKDGEQTLLPFRQNRLQGAWACLRELDSLSSSTKRVDPRATTRVHALRRGRTIPIIDTQRPAASCNTVSVTSSRSRAASLRAPRDHRNLRISAAQTPDRQWAYGGGLRITLGGKAPLVATAQSGSTRPRGVGRHDASERAVAKWWLNDAPTRSHPASDLS